MKKVLFVLLILGSYAHAEDMAELYRQLGLDNAPASLMWLGSPLEIPLPKGQQQIVHFPNIVTVPEIDSRVAKALQMKLVNNALYITGDGATSVDVMFKDQVTETAYYIKFAPGGSSHSQYVVTLPGDMEIEEPDYISLEAESREHAAANLPPSSYPAMVRYIHQLYDAEQIDRDYGQVKRPHDVHEVYSVAHDISLVRAFRGKVSRVWRNQFHYATAITMINPYEQTLRVDDMVAQWSRPPLTAVATLAGYAKPNQAFIVVIVSDRPLEDVLP